MKSLLHFQHMSQADVVEFKQQCLAMERSVVYAEYFAGIAALGSEKSSFATEQDVPDALRKASNSNDIELKLIMEVPVQKLPFSAGFLELVSVAATDLLMQSPIDVQHVNVEYFKHSNGSWQLSYQATGTGRIPSEEFPLSKDASLAPSEVLDVACHASSTAWKILWPSVSNSDEQTSLTVVLSKE